MVKIRLRADATAFSEWVENLSILLAIVLLAAILYAVDWLGVE